MVFAATYIGDTPQIKDLETLFGNVIASVMGIAVVVLFVMLLVGGFTFLMSGGDQKKLDAAKGTLTSAIVGIVVVISAYLILRTIGVITGVSQITTVNLNLGHP
ncbi:hypothetical protein M1555_04205 [Patescibacteria group bacterium]|nr:hypothetical protein [Patescibacteria group bacterium]